MTASSRLAVNVLQLSLMLSPLSVWGMFDFSTAALAVCMTVAILSGGLLAGMFLAWSANRLLPYAPLTVQRPFFKRWKRAVVLPSFAPFVDHAVRVWVETESDAVFERGGLRLVQAEFVKELDRIRESFVSLYRSAVHARSEFTGFVGTANESPIWKFGPPEVN